MKRTTFGKAAIASLLVATTMVGCSGTAFRPSAAAVAKPGKDAAAFAAGAEKALASHDAVAAVAGAEAAVRAVPTNAGYRQLLGRAYIASGRFASAETALSDALTLGNGDPRTIVSLALVQVGLGKPDAARALLTANADKVPATDYGLAIAMAGDATEGVRILSEAIQGPAANARGRQNLAYAYALAGRWKDARVLAGADLDPLVANQRVAQWAMMADPALAPQRVAALMGVEINSADAGLPVALALAPAGATPVAVADAGSAVPSPPIEAAFAAPVQTAAVDPAPAPNIIETAAPAPVSAPVIRADPKPVRTAAVAAKPDFVVEGGKRPMAKGKAVAVAAAIPASDGKMQQVAFLKPAATGASNWVVQLGAYDTAAIAKEKWMSMARVNNTLAAFPVLTSQATVKGKPFHRLAISGFASRADAMRLCHLVQAQRGQCFVREGAPGATPQRWAVASPKGRQYASR